MKSYLRPLIAGAAALALSVSILSATESTGHIDFGSFSPDLGEDYVEVDINPSLLKFSASLIQKEEPEIAEILRNLERVKVHVFGVRDEDMSAVTARMEEIRHNLDGQGWTRVVTVREKHGDNVAVFVKQAHEDSLQGLVVTVIDRSGEAVFVNIVGEVTLDQIARLGEQLDIDPLRELEFDS